jgi:hypothetical protein
MVLASSSPTAQIGRPVRSARPREPRDGVTDGLAWVGALARGGLGVARPPLQARSTGPADYPHVLGLRDWETADLQMVGVLLLTVPLTSYDGGLSALRPRLVHHAR